MSAVGKIVWTVVVVLAAGAALASQVVEVRQLKITHASYTTNAGELTQDVLVGQTFTASGDKLSGIGVLFATYSNRDNTQPVKLHLRRSIHDGEDIRVVSVHPGELKDNQIYRFEFEPIAGSSGEQFFFFLVSPGSAPGNAVTVDLDTRDPYHVGSAYVVRGQGPHVTSPEVLERSGKPTIDMAFQTYHTVPVRVAVIDKITGTVREFIGTWDERKGTYNVWLKIATPAFLFLAVVVLMKQGRYTGLVERHGKEKVTVVLLAVLFVAAVVMRLLYAVELPLTNDEGNYLYDARLLRQGMLAGGDGYVKAPLVIIWISLWQWLFGDTVLAGRLSSIMAGSLTLFPLYLLAREIWSSKSITKSWTPQYLLSPTAKKTLGDVGWGRRVGIVAAAIWAFFGAAIVFNIYVHTQPVALFFGISGLAVLLMALRGTTPRLTFLAARTVPAVASWFIFAGMLLGMGVASRKSILALALVPILFILLESTSWKNRLRHVVQVGLGFLIIIAAFLGAAGYMYGAEGVWEALGLNSAEDGIYSTDPAELEQVRAYSLRGMTPFFRESLPLILLSLIGLGIATEQLIRSLFRAFNITPSPAFRTLADQFVPKIGWIPAWLVFLWAWNFFFEYEGQMFMAYGIRWLWYLFAVVLAFFTLWPRPRSERVEWPKEEKQLVPQSKQPGLMTRQQQKDIQEDLDEDLSTRRYFTGVLMVPLWIFGLVIFYIGWIKFHQNYLAEFIPPLVLLAAFGAVALYRRVEARMFLAKDYPLVELARRMGVLLLSLVLLWSIIISNYITYVFEHTGTFHLGSIEEAAQWAKKHIPPEQPIFTGAAVVPYLSGHHAALDIAHPRWYAYEFTRKDTERLNTFLPPAEEMLQAFREAQWFLHEQQTGFSFMMEYSEIEAGLASDFVPVKEVENGSNTLTFYRRVR